MLRVGVQMEFDSSHFLPSYDGKCQNMHGHTWHVSVEVVGHPKEDGPHIGMILDLHDLKQIVKDVVNILDHKILNSIIADPTCERLVSWFHSTLSVHPLFKVSTVELASIKLQEGDGGWAEWRREDSI